MKEIWKDVAGYEGLYKVSNLGNVYGVKRKKILKPGLARYYFVVLCKDGKRKDVHIHRLVASAFCDNPDRKEEVNHLNEITTDNRAENLEWCTRLENIRWGTGIERHAASQRNGKRSKRISQYSRDGKYIKTYPSIREAHRQTGFDRAAIYRSLVGKRPSAFGYVWRYADQISEVGKSL